MTDALTEALPEDIVRAAERILRRACEVDLALASAESCTGGLLASLLTDVEGCSRAFERGFVVYTEHAKTQMLGVPSAMIEEHTAVSEPVARAMAEGALERSEADIALSITGYAGPGGDDQEEGLVHLACARHDRPTIHREAHYGRVGRAGVRVEALRAAAAMIEEMME